MSERDDISALLNRINLESTMTGFPSMTTWDAADRILGSNWLATHDEQVRAAERERCVKAMRNLDPRPRIGRSIWEFVPRREAIDAIESIPAEQKESN